MADLLKTKPLSTVSTTVVGGVDTPVGGPTSGANVALRSIEHLHDSEHTGKRKLHKGVVAALLGLALIGATVKPAHADTVDVQVPRPQAGLFLDGHMPTGPPDYATLLGTSTTFPGSVTANVTGGGVQQHVDARTQAAFDAFEVKLSQILQRDAGSLASGLRPLTDGSSISSEKQKELEHALGDLVKELPVSSLAPALRNTLETLAGRDLSNARIGDLGKLGGDAVKDLVKQLREEHPKAFWSLAGTAAAAAVTVGYTQGTDALAKLGIKPEISTRIFDDVKLKVGLEAEARLKNARVSVGVDAQHTFDGGSVLKGGVAVQLQGKELAGANVTTTFTTTGGLIVDGGVKLDGSGKPFDARLSASQSFTHSLGGGGTGTVFASGLWSNGTNDTVKQQAVSLGLSGTSGRWTSTVSGTYDLQGDRFTSSLSAGRTYDLYQRNDLDVQIRGTHDSKGETFIGVGITLRF